jgi:hypothetical protein
MAIIDHGHFKHYPGILLSRPKREDVRDARDKISNSEVFERIRKIKI